MINTQRPARLPDFGGLVLDATGFGASSFARTGTAARRAASICASSKPHSGSAASALPDALDGTGDGRTSVPEN